MSTIDNKTVISRILLTSYDKTVMLADYKEEVCALNPNRLHTVYRQLPSTTSKSSAKESFSGFSFYGYNAAGDHGLTDVL